MKEPGDNPPENTPTGRQQKVSDWWSREAARHAGEESYMLDWTCSPVIVEVLNRRATGRDDRNWLQWVKERLPGGKVELALSIGCGRGVLERDAIRQGLCERMEGIDIAAGAIEIAVKEAGDLPVTYRVADLQKDALEPGRYDAVFCASTLHHIKDLGYSLAQISGSLKSGGVLVLSEYVGPTRFQWEPEQLRRVMDVYSFLPAAYRFNMLSGGTVFFPMRPGIAEMVDGDPSEAVRAGEMLQVVEWFFERTARLDLGGTLLNPLLSGIAGNFDTEDPLDRSFLLLASLLEDLWVEAGVLPSDFVIDIYTRRPEPSAPPGALDADAEKSARIGEQEVRIASLQEQRRKLGARHAEYEARYFAAVRSLQDAGPEEVRLKEQIASLRAGVAPRTGASAEEGGQGAPIAATFEHAMRLFASPDARAIDLATEGAPAWARWAAEVTGCSPQGVVLGAGATVSGRNGERFFVTAEPAGGATDERFEARLLGCLPRGWAVVAQAQPPPAAAAEGMAVPPPMRLHSRRRFFAGAVERPAGGGAMARCVEGLIHYLAAEAAGLGLLSPAVEVSIYSEASGPGPQARRTEDISFVQEAEIARLEGLLREVEDSSRGLESQTGLVEAELARARESLDALKRERDILGRPWPLRKAGMWREKRRRSKCGL